MKFLILSLIMISFVVISGCTEKTDSSSIRSENVEINEMVGFFTLTE